MYVRVAFIILYHISSCLSGKVTWLPNRSFSLPFNFENGMLPCSKQIVVFPKTLSATIRIESNISVGGFVLPADGELVLEDGVIELGPTDDNCNEGNTYYTDKTISVWMDPDVWSSPRFNKATPDAERIPCFDDVVEFPNNTQFTVLLPNKIQKIQSLTVNGKNYNTPSFYYYVVLQSNEAQQFIMNEYYNTGIDISSYNCRSPSGCPCQSDMKIECTAKVCPKPSCLQPVKPIGHCCQICGGVISFNVDGSFDMTLFKKRVEQTVESYGRDNLIYHIGKTAPDIVQLVIVEKNEYTGTSAEAVNEIAYNTENNLELKLQISGSPLYKSGLGGKIFISMFFTVILIMAGVYIYYYRLPDAFKLPEMRMPIITGGQSSLFARFDRRTDSVVSLTRRDSIRTIGPSEATAFNNPLYDSKRRSVDESSMEE